MANLSDVFREYVTYLFAGRRTEARDVVLNAQDHGTPAKKLLEQVIWPAMDQVSKLYRENHISRIVEHMAARINRMVADQLAPYLAREPKTGQRMVIVCGEGEGEELGAQMLSDLFEAQGWHVWFLGSGVPNDEILQFVGKLRPDVLCIHGALPANVPGVRKLIEFIREIGAVQDMQVMVVGGVFGRADGLSDEIKADLFAPDAEHALAVVVDHPVRIPKPDMPEPGRRRKRKSRTATAPKAHAEMRT